MSVITRLSQLFSKQKSSHVVGVSLHQQSLSFSHFLAESEGETSSEKPTSIYQNIPLNNNTYAQALAKAKTDNEWQGQCHLVLASHLSQIVQVDRPKVPDTEINGALKWQIKDLVTITPDNMVVDYFDIPTLNIQQDKINVVCSPLNELKDIVAAVNDDDIEIASIVTEEFAFSGLLPSKSEPSLLVCCQPNEEAMIIIVKDGQLCFHRRLRGFAQISEKSPQELDMGAIDSLSLEIQRSTDYFERQLKQAPVREVLILVPMENEAYLARRLAENSNLRVDLLAMPEGYEEHRKFACAIGATLLANKEVSDEQ